MAKRKRSTVPTTSRKRGTGHAHGDIDPEKEYKVKSIVGETKTRYLISWEDDEETGEVYIDTWEPKSHVNREAVRDWERQKAEKERVERQSGGAAASISSNSISTSPAPTSPKKTIRPKQRKGRPIKVIQSSSPPTEPQQTNGNLRHQSTGEVLEIDESQHSRAGDLPPDSTYSEVDSPLFVPQEIPAEQPRRIEVNVQLSQPPSSYFAGAYEPVSSSQPAPSTQLPSDNQPEPSQFVPDPADTSRTTNDTTEVSVVPTTPSQQATSVPVNFDDSPSRLIADSQSLPGSSSYLPPAEVATSEIESAAQDSYDISSEQIPVSIADQVESGTGEALPVSPGPEADVPVSSQLIPPDQHIQTQGQASPQHGNKAQSTDNADGGAESTESRLAVNGQDSSDIRSESRPDRSSTEDLEAGVDSSGLPQNWFQVEELDAQVSGGAADITAQSPSHSPSSATSALNSQGDSPNSEAGGQQAIATDTSAFEPTSAQPQSEGGRSLNPSSLNQAEEGPNSEPDDSSNKLSGIPDQGTHRNLHSYLNASQVSEVAVAPNLDTRENPTIVSAEANPTAIDLTSTTEEPATSLDVFSVTPPGRNAIATTQSFSQPQPLYSSDWQSPFPFVTQVQRPISVNTLLYGSEAPNFLSQPLLQDSAPVGDPSAIIARSGSVPIGNYPPLLTSSPIPQAPPYSLSIPILGESAPLRPTTPSSSPLRASSAVGSMDGSQNTPKSTGALLTERLGEMRAKKRSKLANERTKLPSAAPDSSSAIETPDSVSHPAPPSTDPPLVPIIKNERPSAIPARLASPLLLAQDGWRSPSAVPHLEPLPVISQEEMNTSERYETLMPQSQDYEDDMQRNGSLTAAVTLSKANSGEDPEKANLHTIPISMIGTQRDQYSSTVFFYRDSIQRFLDDSSPNAELEAKLSTFVERMRRITMHPDLDNSETLTQYDVDPTHQADWDVKCSAKFRFLKELFNCLRERTVTIAIIALPGRVVDMLETFLQGKEISYRRLGVSTTSEWRGQGSVKALVLDTNAEIFDSESADLVVAMENLVRHDTPQIQSLRRSGSHWAPFVSLIVPRTVEHIERCLSSTLSDRAASRALVSGIFQFRGDAGRLEVGQQPPKETAVALAQYLTSEGDNGAWPITPPTLLQDLGSQTESDPDLDGSTSVHVGAKRSREPDETAGDATEANKRMRIATQGTHAEEGEVTHISDSIDKATQSNETGLEVEELIQLTPIEKRLQSLLLEAQEQLEEHKQALGDLQFRHEERRSKLVEVTVERDAAIQTAKTAVSRMGEQSGSMSALRTKCSELEEELKDANNRLLDHSVPERAEFEALRLAAAAATADKEKTETRLQQAQRDLDYVRGLYQSSSSSAQEMATENADLQNQLAVLQNKATGEQAKLRQMSYDAFTKNLQSENKKLKSMMKDREAAIKFRDDEITRLREASRGRIGTRGTSVPRTPRVGSPMRMVGSRQASPAAGEIRHGERPGLLHPLRNTQG